MVVRMFPVPRSILLEPAAKAPSHRIGVATAARCWSTSAFGVAVDTSPLELRDLSEHLRRCRRASGAFFSALCVSDSVSHFLAPRVVTTLAVIAMVAGAVSAVL